MSNINKELLAYLIDGLRKIFKNDYSFSNNNECLSALKQIYKLDKNLFTTLVRIAVNNSNKSSFFLQQIYNLWKLNGSLPLKPTQREIKVLMLTDYTSTNLLPYMEIIGATRGIKLNIDFSEFDSVENLILDSNSNVYKKKYDVVVLSLSEHWVAKYIDQSHIVNKDDLHNLESMLANLINNLQESSISQIYVTNFISSAFPKANGFHDSLVCCGHQVMLMRLNNMLLSFKNDQLSIIDLQTALHISGGIYGVGRRSYFLAKMAFEPSAIGFISSEIVHTIAGGLGQNCRAVVVDWDNTIWGGELAELGIFDVSCGLDNSDALAFYHLQIYLKHLKDSGVLLATASRNDSAQASLIDENNLIPLITKDFSSIQVDLCPKSKSIANISNDIGFCEEYMLFIDDNLFEIAEVLLSYPYIDILWAGSGPEETLEVLSQYRFFNQGFFQDTDRRRAEQITKLTHQKKQRNTFKNNNDFLASIDIYLTIKLCDESSKPRVFQLLQKTNQFNLTTKRYSNIELDLLISDGAKVLVIEYGDSFGFQGVISVVIIKELEKDSFLIDTWLMSCRVLNRGVELAVFEWIINNTTAQKLIGNYIKTVKNGLVKELFQELGFTSIDSTVEYMSCWMWNNTTHRKKIEHHIKKINGIKINE